MSSNAALLTAQQQQLRDRRAAAFVNNKSRDPRAIPVSFSRNVSSPESCEFYGVADAISGCRVPRSCQDCLATPGCGLGGDAVCRNVSTSPDYFGYQNDFRNATFGNNSPNVSTSSRHNFLAGAATYCAASDPVCMSCREEFQRIAITGADPFSRQLDTRFCRGDDGCVCIGACEVPEQRIPDVLDKKCGQPIIYSQQLPKISRRSHIVARNEPRAPVILVNYTSPRGESCAYTSDADLRGCRRPRTCRDCLQRPGCMISKFKCDDMSGYNWYYDFRRAKFDIVNHSRLDSTVYTQQIPSTNATYCSASDAACRLCQSGPGRRADWSTMSSNSLMCLGQDGCVCLEACENELWYRGVYDTECLQLDKSNVEPASPLSTLAIAVGVWIVLWTVYKLSSYKPTTTDQDETSQPPGRSQPHRGLLRHMLDEVPGLARLDLFGWRAHQEELYYREQELLLGVEITHVRPHVDFDHMDPSAPDFDEDESSAPTAQDPKALASAPVFRSSFIDDNAGDGSSHSTQDTSHSSPSAPDFDLTLEEEEWGIAESSHGEQQEGLVSRTSRRGDVET